MESAGKVKPRYARITHRFAVGAASGDDEAGKALAELLERRAIDSIVADCRSYVTSDLLSQRLQRAVAALSEQGVVLRLEADLVIVERCFCETEGCQHPAALLERLIGVSIASIITREGRRALRMVGALGAARYTQEASTSAQG
jgi:hypothetical protein